jgi:hypothetical protein
VNRQERIPVEQPKQPDRFEYGRLVHDGAVGGGLDLELEPLLEASRAMAPSDTIPVVLADAGVENVNAQVDALIHTGVLRRVLAFTELKFSNSMIEAWWRSLKHQWLFLQHAHTVARRERVGNAPGQDAPREIVDHGMEIGPGPVEQADHRGIDVPHLVRASGAKPDLGFCRMHAKPGPTPAVLPDEAVPG